jgi:hypothetical protein
VVKAPLLDDFAFDDFAFDELALLPRELALLPREEDVRDFGRRCEEAFVVRRFELPRLLLVC